MRGAGTRCGRRGARRRWCQAHLLRSSRGSPLRHEPAIAPRTGSRAAIAPLHRLAPRLEGLGYGVIREIDRDSEQYLCRGATVRVERYPRMDALVEVEGTPTTIEEAIAATGLPRDGFTAERLPDFVRRFELRTGLRAALCERELTGDYRFSVDDA